MEHIVLKKISMKNSPDLSERWVQNVLENDPSLLGFGEVNVQDTERRQPGAGRLDMLLSDSDSNLRYEVELQLGATDETHIIRTIEYWDNERRRYPHYEHVAVIVAEEITSRFFNVISLFNGFIPLVAIQMTAVYLGDNRVSLLFTKVLDHVALGTDEEDKAEPTDRDYWEKRSTPAMLRLVDRLHKLVAEHDPGVTLNYTKHYVGLMKNRKADNYVQFLPQKRKVNVSFRIPRSDEVTDMIDESGIGTLPWDRRWNSYRLIIADRSDIDEYRRLMTDLLDIARSR